LDSFNNVTKFVRKNARKRFVASTKEQALQDFMFRKQKQQRIFHAQLEEVQICIDKAQELIKGE
jgi:hypothetical protein